ncbi:SDR family oxidoreductase [Kurthia sibirica]|uniref:Gluconate 5-dehydrogenase n=1 Tax=Kurthia sibirica TaxID=202750 RepID=A0A2U3AR49_9BACL|nr:SDR family oxidoreductase [Kurthia sibirica]PWI27022.1 gluconate 5-dehydrogenase [Kurthia sibirica]GEK35328.1 gluconate 5-dehydrogenase [Kurthia sibirica]
MTVLQLFELTGKTALITGGGRGLGATMARGFAEAGISNLILCSRKLANCQEVAETIKKEYAINILTLQCDVTDENEINKTVDAAVAHFGEIDILINNSGATWGAPVVEMPKEAWDKVIATNVTGTFLMSQAVGRYMIEQQQGVIINLASVAGFGGSPAFMDTIGYNTSKGAVMTFTKDLAVKWGQHNIRVNAIAPGFFPTKMSNQTIVDGYDYIINSTPLGRLGTDEDLTGVAVFLASAASQFMTGQIISVDGGSTAL